MIAVYCRVSSIDQTEACQRYDVERWLQGHGLEATWFVDKGTTGDHLERPEFTRLQTAIFAGEVQTVVVYKLDRLSRTLRDGINTLTDWLKAGVRIVSVTQQLDFSGATGQLVAAVLFAVAQMEQETRRERQAAGIAVAKIQGKYAGRRKDTTKAKPARVVELRKRGLNDGEIATSLGLSRRTVQRYLNLAKCG